VHRDVSPQNVLVGVDGIARLVDFGVAKARGRLQGSTDVANGPSPKGKYPYMAPEQVRGDAVTRQTDLFAASIVLWELLTGERLFHGRNAAESMQRILRGRIPPAGELAPGVPPALDDVLARGLARDRAARYATAREMALAVEGCAPRAAPSVIGSWVERLVGERLRARADAIAKLESRRDFHQAITGTRESRVIQRDLPTTVSVPPPMVAEPVPPPASAALRSSREPTRSRPERSIARTRGAMLLAGVAALLGASVASAAWALRPKPAATLVVHVPAAVPAPARSEVATPSEPLPQAPASEPTSAAPRSPPPRPALGTESRPVLRSTPPPSRGPSRRTHGCDPPYSLDSEGREVFKPECL
jgi:serine/threonine-protein kinase